MPTRVNTGGEKSFVYTGKETYEDTGPTRAFKNALRHNRSRKGMRDYYKDKKIPIPEHHKRYMEGSIPNIKKSDKTFLFVLIMIVLIVGGIYVYNERNVVDDSPKIVADIEEEEEVEEQTSFTEYLSNYADYDKEKVTLTGFVSRGIEKLGSGGVYVEYIVDDFDNGITLLNLNKEQIRLFPKTGTTDELYNITGIFKRKYKGLDLQVTEIIKTERQKILIKKEKVDETPIPILIEEDKPKELNFTKIFDFIKKLPSATCKEGERFYKTQCIPIITCSDETLHPECSTDKPKQCINGSLVNKASICGCPQDYKIKGDSCEKIKRCEDRTIYDECSKEKPLFCEKGKLIEKASKCGCGYSFVAKGDNCMSRDIVKSQEATEYVNQLRKQYGRNELKWNEDLYELAMFRTKDMYDRRYFDHVTPDGKCVNNFKSNYGLGGYTIAENAGAVVYSMNGDFDVDYASYADPIGQVDGWMESRGHRYNLLYPDHVIGVVACYKGACVFLGGNTDAWGLGAGPCSTGAEGTAYWQSAGKQAGEV